MKLGVKNLVSTESEQDFLESDEGIEHLHILNIATNRGMYQTYDNNGDIIDDDEIKGMIMRKNGENNE